MIKIGRIFMNRFFKGMSYTFNRNLGWQDRLIRFGFALLAISSWYFGIITGIIGVILAVSGFMILGTATISRCSITYFMNANTMGEAEKSKLAEKGIQFE
jgi:hypothetical protein